MVPTVVPVEEIVVVRLEGLGTFAVPLAVLDEHRVPASAERGAAMDLGEVDAAGGTGAVPVILREDYLHGATSRRGDLVVDAFWYVRHAGCQPLSGWPGRRGGPGGAQ